jgi:hypothetical protein
MGRLLRDAGSGSPAADMEHSDFGKSPLPLNYEDKKLAISMLYYDRWRVFKDWTILREF